MINKIESVCGMFGIYCNLKIFTHPDKKNTYFGCDNCIVAAHRHYCLYNTLSLISHFKIN